MAIPVTVFEHEAIERGTAICDRLIQLCAPRGRLVAAKARNRVLLNARSLQKSLELLLAEIESDGKERTLS